ncbi:MAG: DUF2520 domain-containing protein [Myxococcota bacterium]
MLFAPLYDVTTVGRDLSLPKHSDVVLLTVPDHAVAEVAQAVPQGPVVLHCAGALDLDVLAPHQRRGSFHPLMTFPGPELGLPDPSDVPVALAGEPEALGVARRLADDVGMRAFEVPGDRRLYHAAAVIAGNLAMVLMDEAATVLEHAGVGREVAFDVLTPLALRSVNNAALGLPQALTGPIARSDQTTLDGHRAALQAHHPAALPFYEALVERAIARLSPATSEVRDDLWQLDPVDDPEGDLS